MNSVDTKMGIPSKVGDYEILSKIAEGGMGTVYKARSLRTGELVAVKILLPSTAKNPVLLKRFEQECRAAAALEHEHVVRVLDYCGVGASPYLVMEYVDGESLGKRIEREGPLDENEAIRLIAQVCEGLHKAHKQRLIHRDVKPDNILVTRDGVAKLTDLGLVKNADDELNLTKTGRGLGTPNFMAPEQFRDAKNADVRCDIYSLGATLYMAVTGEVPFGKVGPLDCWMRKIRNELPAPREVNPKISERVDWAIRRAMSADPEQRPASCKEFVEDLTGASLRKSSPPAAEGSSDSGQQNDLWYLVYRDEDGETHTVKGSSDGIRRALRDGLLGDSSNIRAARTKQGPFQGLHTYPEFRDLVIAPAPLKPASGTHPAPPSSQSGIKTRSGSQSRTPSRLQRPDPEQIQLSERGTSRRLPGVNPDSNQPKIHLNLGQPNPHLSREKSSLNPMILGAVVAFVVILAVLGVYLLFTQFQFKL